MVFRPFMIYDFFFQLFEMLFSNFNNFSMYKIFIKEFEFYKAFYVVFYKLLKNLTSYNLEPF